MSFGGIVGAVARYDLAEAGLACGQPDGRLVVDTNAETESASTDPRGDVRFLPHTLHNAFFKLRESVSIPPEGQEALCFADGLPRLEPDVEGILSSVEGEALDCPLLLDREHRPFALGHILPPRKTCLPRLPRNRWRKNAGADAVSLALQR